MYFFILESASVSARTYWSGQQGRHLHKWAVQVRWWWFSVMYNKFEELYPKHWCEQTPSVQGTDSSSAHFYTFQEVTLVRSLAQPEPRQLFDANFRSVQLSRFSHRECPDTKVVRISSEVMDLLDNWDQISLGVVWCTFRGRHHLDCIRRGWWIHMFTEAIIWAVIFLVIFSFWVFIILLLWWWVLFSFYPTILLRLRVFGTIRRFPIVSSTLLIIVFSFLTPFFSCPLRGGISSFSLFCCSCRPFGSFLQIARSNIFSRSDRASLTMWGARLLCLLSLSSPSGCSASLVVFTVHRFVCPRWGPFESPSQLILVTHVDPRLCIAILVWTCHLTLLMSLYPLTTFCYPTCHVVTKSTRHSLFFG